MYKITTVVPNNELQTLNEGGDLSPIESEGTTTVITTAQENDASLRLIVGFCKMIAGGKVKSLTITKDDDHDDKTDC